MARWGEMVEEEDDDEYAKLVRKMNPPRVVIDNDACDNATVIRVDRVKKHGILLEAVQVLVDLNLVITKAYTSSDGNWFMDVFNVTDQDGSKLQNMEVIDHIQKCLESDGYLAPPAKGPLEDQFTSIELTGADRPALNDLQYVVFHGTVDAEGASKEAYQEYYIRHVDGHPVRSDAERTRLVRCLEAAVERRASNGLELELEVRTEDRVGLLSEITTKDGKAEDTFYVSDTYGNPVDGRTVDAVGEQLGDAVLRVKRRGHDASVKRDAEGGAVSVLGSLLKGSFQGLRLIRSCS